MIIDTQTDIEKILVDKYNIKAIVNPLAGEVDYNFKVISDENTYLLKICRPDVNEQEVEFQVALLDHLQNKELLFEVPKIIDTINGDKYFVQDFDNKKCIVRLHSWVSGIMLDDINPRTKDLYFSWGATCLCLFCRPSCNFHFFLIAN